MIDRSGELDYLRRNDDISFAGNEAGERVLRWRILGMNPELMKHAASAVMGGAIGSLMRFAVGAWFVHQHPESKFPWNTLMLNLVGCLVIGLIYGWVEDRWLFGIHLRHFLVTGVLGGFTTFSAFGAESVFLFRRGESLLAGTYIIASVAGGLILAWVGERIASALFR